MYEKAGEEQWHHCPKCGLKMRRKEGYHEIQGVKGIVCNQCGVIWDYTPGKDGSVSVVKVEKVDEGVWPIIATVFIILFWGWILGAISVVLYYRITGQV